jgi:hypothetical protein
MRPGTGPVGEQRVKTAMRCFGAAPDRQFRAPAAIRGVDRVPAPLRIVPPRTVTSSPDRVTDNSDMESYQAWFHSGIDGILFSLRRKPAMKKLERACLDSAESRDQIDIQSHCSFRPRRADECKVHSHRHDGLWFQRTLCLTRPCCDKRAGHIRLQRKCDR